MSHISFIFFRFFYFFLFSLSSLLPRSAHCPTYAPGRHLRRSLPPVARIRSVGPGSTPAPAPRHLAIVIRRGAVRRSTESACCGARRSWRPWGGGRRHGRAGRAAEGPAAGVPQPARKGVPSVNSFLRATLTAASVGFFLAGKRNTGSRLHRPLSLCPDCSPHAGLSRRTRTDKPPPGVASVARPASSLHAGCAAASALPADRGLPDPARGRIGPRRWPIRTGRCSVADGLLDGDRS